MQCFPLLHTNTNVNQLLRILAAISRANLKCVGSHCGVSIGEDGPSQMALEDIAMFRAIPDCRVFYPCDAVSMERATELAAQHVGMDFIRTSRPATPVIYSNDTKFAVGKAQIVLKHGMLLPQLAFSILNHSVIKLIYLLLFLQTTISVLSLVLV